MRDFLVSKSYVNTYILECEPVMDTNLLANSDLYSQSSDSWVISSTCTSGNNIGRADHRYSPSSYKSHVAGYQYSWIAQERIMHNNEK
jgi:hypothetical protein